MRAAAFLPSAPKPLRIVEQFHASVHWRGDKDNLRNCEVRTREKRGL